jgi:hypothetical protein
METSPLAPTRAIDAQSYRALCLFAQGVPKTDIALDLGCSLTHLSSIFKNYPIESEECRKRLDAVMATEQRSMARAADCISARILERYASELEDPETQPLRRQEIMGDLKMFATVAEISAKRADSLEGKATQRIEHLYSVQGVTIVPPVGAQPFPQTEIIDAEVVGARYTDEEPA